MISLIKKLFSETAGEGRIEPASEPAKKPPTKWLDPYATRSIPTAKPATEPATEPPKRGAPPDNLLEAVESLRDGFAQGRLRAAAIGDATCKALCEVNHRQANALAVSLGGEDVALPHLPNLTDPPDDDDLAAWRDLRSGEKIVGGDRIMGVDLEWHVWRGEPRQVNAHTPPCQRRVEWGMDAHHLRDACLRYDRQNAWLDGERSALLAALREIAPKHPILPENQPPIKP